ncbi:MAG: hypothetical protein HY519_01490 [Candidatus Aenigmarchaeota archaeon]|nr:hypothetical protein [Candidatus Aenigmarchaeota archaeon]
MLSDRGIKRFMENGQLSVEPARIRSASIDLELGSELYVSDTSAIRSITDEMVSLTKQGKISEREELGENFMRLPAEQYLSRFAQPVTATDGYWELLPDQLYYVQTNNKVKIRPNVEVRVVSRSSLARLGLEVQNVGAKMWRREGYEGHPLLMLRTQGTTVRLPTGYPVCQMIVNHFGYLGQDELQTAMASGEISISGNPAVWENYALLTLHPKMLRYNGAPMDPTKDTSNCFDEIDVANGFELEPYQFYLGSTQEAISLAAGYVGVLDDYTGPVSMHTNAPFHWPGPGHNMTLEMFAHQPGLVHAGSPICKLYFDRLHPECGFLYQSSNYNDQQGPTPSRSHLQSRFVPID